MTTYRLGERVAVLDRPDHDDLYVAPLPDGPVLTINGSGPLVWRLVLELGTDDAVITKIAELTGSDPATVAPGVRAFLEYLADEGVLLRGA